MNYRNVVKDEDILKWEGLVFKICKKYSDNPTEDMLQFGRIGLWKGLLTYNYDNPTASLITYLARTITNEVFMYFRIESKQNRVNTLSLQNLLNTDEHGHELTLEDVIENKCNQLSILEYVQCFETIWNKTNPRDRQIFKMWFEGKKQGEISKVFGISQSYVSRIIKRIQEDFRGGSR